MSYFFIYKFIYLFNFERDDFNMNPRYYNINETWTLLLKGLQFSKGNKIIPSLAAMLLCLVPLNPFVSARNPTSLPIFTSMTIST